MKKVQRRVYSVITPRETVERYLYTYFLWAYGVDGGSRGNGTKEKKDGG